MKTPKSVLSSEYQLFLKKNYPEHLKKIVTAKHNASMTRILYPVTFFLTPLFMFVSLSTTLILFRDTIARFLDETRFADFTTPASVQTTGFILIGIGILVSLFSFFFGVYLGFAKAREMLFDHEKLELQTRQLWVLENLNQDKNLMYNNHNNHSFNDRKSYVETETEHQTQPQTKAHQVSHSQKISNQKI